MLLSVAVKMVWQQIFQQTHSWVVGLLQAAEENDPLRELEGLEVEAFRA